MCINRWDLQSQRALCLRINRQKRIDVAKAARRFLYREKSSPTCSPNLRIQILREGPGTPTGFVIRNSKYSNIMDILTFKSIESDSIDLEFTSVNILAALSTWRGSSLAQTNIFHITCNYWIYKKMTVRAEFGRLNKTFLTRKISASHYSSISAKIPTVISYLSTHIF